MRWSKNSWTCQIEDRAQDFFRAQDLIRAEELEKRYLTGSLAHAPNDWHDESLIERPR